MTAPLAKHVIDAMKQAESPSDAAVLRRFFKTGKGQYGEGDVFLGIRNPQTRLFAREFRALPLPEIALLLDQEYHEIRLCGLLIAVDRFKRGNEEECAGILKLYRAKSRNRINNWDLVDLSAPGIVGENVCRNGAESLEWFAESPVLWRQRIAVVSTLPLIRHGIFTPTLELAERFLDHPHDLMHKACGWMLREVGKRDREYLSAFLREFKDRMPRTMLRYAIEHYPETERQAFLKRAVR